MNSKKFSEALNEVENKYIDEAISYKKKAKKPVWIGWAAAAACVCLVIFGALFLRQPAPVLDSDNPFTVSEDGVTIPKMNVSLAADNAADMVAFFIYQGRCYVQYEWVYEAESLVGEYLGTATGLINEWTPADGYVDFAGSVRGDFYAVNGYDPTFMLCMQDGDDGAVQTYICDNGITLKYGSELYEDRLHLSENIVSAQFESRDSWYYSRGERYPLDDSDAAVTAFLSALDSALFMPYNEVPLNGRSHLSEMELYHLYFQMQNGTTVRLRLHENGYVRFDGMWSLCVQIPEESFNALLKMIENTIE